MTPTVELLENPLLAKLKVWLNLNSGVANKLVVYALAECIQDQLSNIDLTDVEKGAILTHLFNHLSENNKVELATFRETKRAEREGRTATKH